MADVAAGQRGVVAGLLTLSRNLGLISDASAMGAVFAASGLGLSFFIATGLLAVALGLASRAK